MITTTKFVSLTFLAVGTFILMQVVLPIISFQIWQVSQNFNSQILQSPKSSNQILGVSIQSKDDFPSFISSHKREITPPYTQFLLSVPSINLNDTNVFVDSNDLSKGLAQLPGTALPGEKGNLFISGHSALNNFWNKDAYFAKLMDVKIGDKIEIDAGGAKFIYQVISMKAVDPTDLSVIAPLDDEGRYVSLMTCVPPGLNLKRLVVLGKML